MFSFFSLSDLSLGSALLVFSGLLLGSVLGISVQTRGTFRSFLASFTVSSVLAAFATTWILWSQSSIWKQIFTHSARMPFWMLFACAAFFGSLVFLTLDQYLQPRGGFLRKSATLIDYFTQKKKQIQAQKLQTLCKVFFLRNLPTQDLKMLVRYVKEVYYDKNTILFDQGSVGDQLFFLLEGKVELFENETYFKTLEQGDTLGEIALLTDTPRTAKAVTKTPVKALVLTKEDFKTLRKHSSVLDQTAHRLASVRAEELESYRKKAFQRPGAHLKQAIQALELGTEIPLQQEMQKARTDHGRASWAILTGLFLDTLPESLLLGTLAATIPFFKHKPTVFSKLFLLTSIALLISNFVQSLSSTQGLKAQGWPSQKIMSFWALAAFLGFSCFLGSFWLLPLFPHLWIFSIQAVALGAYLTMILGALIPEASCFGTSAWIGLGGLIGFLMISAISFL